MPTFPQPGLERRWKKLPGQPDGDGGDPYTGYDRFGRTERMLWGRPQEGGGFEKLVEVQWGYDRASLKTWRNDLLAPVSTHQDQHFGYDGLYQVTQRQRGLLNVNTTAVGGVPAQQEQFAYDETGNWVNYRQANAGELDIDQTRANNRSNQIAQVDGSSEGISYDRKGNMLEVPTGEGLTGPSRKPKWDAWNRLREVRDAADHVIASYQYDAATRRTVETTGEGESAVSRHFYYNDQWRSVEERIDTSTQPERQYVWHPSDRYELLLRDRSTQNDGELDERLYPMKDQLDLVALCDATGTVVERYAYSAFGMTTFLNSSFIPQPSSLVAWNFLFHAEFADPQTGWFNYGYRYYLPELGRWPSRDPIGEEGGVNLYGVVRNCPLNRLDRFGLIAGGGATPSGVPRGPCPKCILSYVLNDDETSLSIAASYPAGTKVIPGRQESGGVSQTDSLKRTFEADAKKCKCVNHLYLTQHGGTSGQLLVGGAGITGEEIMQIEAAKTAKEAALRAATNQAITEILSFISRHMCKDGKITFVQCKVKTQGPQGEALQQWIKETIGPNVSARIFSGSPRWVAGSLVGGGECTTITR